MDFDDDAPLSFDDDDATPKKPSKTSYLPTHLDSPLRTITVLQALGHLRGVGYSSARKHYLKLLEALDIPGVTDVHHPKIFPHLWKEILETNVVNTHSREYKESLVGLEVGLDNYNFQSPSISKLNGVPHRPLDIDFSTPGFHQIRRIVIVRERIEKLVMLTATGRQSDDYWTYHHGCYQGQLTSGMHVVATSKLCIIQSQHGSTLVDRDGLLMMSDLISERLLVLQAAELAQQLGEPTYPRVITLFQLFDWGDSILIAEGNEGYNAISCWEGILMGAIHQFYPDNLCDNTTFFRESLKSMTKALQPAHRVESLNRLLILLLDLSTNPHHLSQAFGLYRIWGHPVVDGVRGIQKLKKTVCREKVLNMETIKNITCTMKEQLCMNYRRKYSRWPNLDVSALPVNSPVRQAVVGNKALEIKNPNYNLHDWALVKGEKTFDIDPSYNLSTVISDKALSLTKTELQAAIAQHGNIGFPRDRRVISQWLHSTLDDPRTLLEKIDKEGFSDEDSVIGMVEKEREMKIEARMYALLTLIKRMYVVLTEALLADKILPLFPEITMTDDLITLLKKIYANSEKLSNAEEALLLWISIIVNIDFEKWNSNMRKASSLGLFTFIDELFGFTGVFSRTHEMFEEAFLYLANGHYVPSFDAQGNWIFDECCWTLHKGGIEGLRQKGWTLFTIAILLWVTRKLACRFKLMAAGDNVAVNNSYPFGTDGRDGVKAQHALFLAELDRTLEEVGLPIKVSETWSSTTTFAYNKVLVLKGVVLCMSLKRACRMFKLSNDGYPTLESSLSSISANISAAVNAEMHPAIAFILGSSESYGCIRLHMSHSLVAQKSLTTHAATCRGYTVPTGKKQRIFVKIPRTQEWLSLVKNQAHKLATGLLILPKCLGGYPITLLPSLLCRGFPDALTEAITHLSHCRKACPDHPLTQFIPAILSPRLLATVNQQLLIQDPNSINLASPPSPDGILKLATLDFLDKISSITNERFLTFYKLARKNQDELIRLLFTMIKLNPRLCSEIFKSTLEGYAMSLMGRIQKTTTMVSWVQAEGDWDLLKNIGERECSYFVSALHQLLTLGIIEWGMYMCSREHAQSLREIGWQRNDIVGITVPHPIEIFTGYQLKIQGCMCCQLTESGYILIGIPEDFFRESSPPFRTIMGPCVPYFGSKTVERALGNNRAQEVATEPLLQRPVKLQRIVGWMTERGSHLTTLIEGIMHAVTDLSPRMFQPPDGTITGASEHRFKDDASDHGGSIAHSYQPATYVNICTTSLKEYSKGSKNVNLHFQSSMLCGQAAVVYGIMPLQHMTKDPIYGVHLHPDCTRCITEVHEDIFDLPYLPTVLPISSDPSNPLCYIKSAPDEQMATLPLPPVEIVFSNGDTQLINVIAYPKMGQEVIRDITKNSLVGDQQMSRAGESASIPHAWVYRLDPTLLLETVTIMLMSHFLYFIIPTNFGQTSDAFDLIGTMYAAMETLSGNVFSSLSLLLITPETRRSLSTGKFSFPLPSSLPMSLSSVCFALKSGIGEIAHALWEQGHLHSAIWPPHLLPQYHEVSLSRWPVFWKLTEILVRDHRQSPSDVLVTMKVLRILGKNIPSGMDLGLIDPNQFLDLCIVKGWTYHCRPSEVRCAQAIMKLIPPAKYFEESSDYLSRFLIGREVHLMDNFPFITSKITGLDNIVIIAANHANTLSKVRNLPVGHGHHLPSSSGVKHILRYYNNSTTATGKWCLILNPHVRLFRRVRTIGVFGDGHGGISLHAERLSHGQAKVFYNSLIDIRQIVTQTLTQLTPAAFDTVPLGLAFLYPLRESIEGPTDLTAQDTAQYIRSLHPAGFEIVLLDAEGEGPDNPDKALKMAETLLQVMASDCQLIVFKTYMTHPLNVMVIYSMFATFFTSVEVVQSQLSAALSTEVFIIATCKRPTPLEKYTLIFGGPTVLYSGWMVPKAVAETGKAILIRVLSSSVSLNFELAERVSDMLSTPWSIRYGQSQVQSFFPFIIHRDLAAPYSAWVSVQTMINPIRYRQKTVFHMRYRLFKLTKAVLGKIAMAHLIAEEACTLKATQAPIAIEDTIATLYLVTFKSLKFGWKSCITHSLSPGPLKTTLWTCHALSDLLNRNMLKRVYYISGILYHNYWEKIVDRCHSLRPWDWSGSQHEDCNRYFTKRDSPSSPECRAFLHMVPPNKLPQEYSSILEAHPPSDLPDDDPMHESDMVAMFSQLAASDE